MPRLVGDGPADPAGAPQLGADPRRFLAAGDRHRRALVVGRDVPPALVLVPGRRWATVIEGVASTAVVSATGQEDHRVARARWQPAQPVVARLARPGECGR